MAKFGEEVTLKKIIRGRRYDTNSATLVAEDADHQSGTYRIRLYRKKTGEYFRYTWSTPWDLDGTLTPLELAEAKEMASEMLDADLWEKEFAVATDSVSISVRLPETLHERVIKKVGSRTLTDVVIAALELWLENNPLGMQTLDYRIEAKVNGEWKATAYEFDAELKDVRSKTEEILLLDLFIREYRVVDQKGIIEYYGEKEIGSEPKWM